MSHPKIRDKKRMVPKGPKSNCLGIQNSPPHRRLGGQRRFVVGTRRGTPQILEKLCARMATWLVYRGAALGF